MSIAATTPPALKSIHTNGSFDLLLIYPRRRIQVTATDIAAQTR
jgi:hypothetical protein